LLGTIRSLDASFCLSNDDDDSKGYNWLCLYSLGRNARKTPLFAFTLQLGDITVGPKRTEIAVPSWIFIITSVPVATLA
jgi:hypothetical protein